MSREAAAGRARAQSRYIDEAIGRGTTVELMGYRLVVLYADAPAHAPPPHAGPSPPQAAASGERGVPD